MSRYQGGKNRNGRKIAMKMQQFVQTLQSQGRFPLKFGYVEPFMGMAGVLRHVAGLWADHDIVASDRNVGIVRLWQKLLETGSVSFLPTSVSEERFHELKRSLFADDNLAAVRGLVGHALSFGGAYFSGYASKYESDTRRDYLKAGIKAVGRVLPMLQRAKRLRISEPMSYLEYPRTLSGCVIYCDPPYLRNKQCSRNPLYRNFDHKKFWERMEHWSKKNVVFVSEEAAPAGWHSVFAFTARRSHNHHSETRNRNPDSDNVRTKYHNDQVFVHETWLKHKD